MPQDCPFDYAELGWHAEQRGDLKQAYSIYELLAQRPDASRWIYERLAAVAVTLGRFPTAIHAYETLADSDPQDAMTLLTLGHLLMLDGFHTEACGVLERAVDLLAHQEGNMTETCDAVLECLEGSDAALPRATPVDRPGVNRVQMLTQRGLNYLQRGRYVRATELFEDAMNLVESLLVAHGQWLLAESKADGNQLPEHLTDSLVSLAQLSDLLLQYLARTKLAGNVAAAMRERQLRPDLALWVTGSQEVQGLLQTERTRLRELAAQHANHAELHYRIGICNRATGQLEDAAKAFARVLTIEPHHAKTAVYLAATLLQLNRAGEMLEILERSFAMEPAAAQQYYALGVTATDAQKFERAMGALARDLGVGFAAQDAKANLAFALGMLGIKDAQRDQWRECGTQNEECEVEK